ncbi:MAG: histidine ammonia-lyase [Flavobacteriales bacterium]|nr:histidine ammonia-lyase [Flavobacteriales bacterium]
MSNQTTYVITETAIEIGDVNFIISNNAILSLDDKVIQKVKKCRDFLDAKVQDNSAVFYGINTGFGSLCNKVISKTDLKQLQTNLVKSHACGSGDEIDPVIVKIMILLKIKSLSLGHSGVTMNTLNRLVYMFNNNILPVIYEMGSLGASGDLAPLAHLSLGLIGEGYVDYNGKRQKTINVLNELGVAPIELSSKEGLALLNGTQFMSAFAAYSLMKINNLYSWIEKISAISIDAFNCSLDPYNPLIHQVRPHKGQIKVAKKVLELLSDSSISSTKKDNVQDPYSFRCIPQVHGASIEVVERVSKVVELEINSVTDNPTIFPDENLILSAGNFHGQPLALSLDALCIAVAELGSISERRIYKLISGQRDLPDFLVANPGLNSGFMIPQYTAASIVSKNKVLCHPASVDSIDSSNGQEDHVSMGSIAAVKLLSVVENVERIVSIELMTSTQAIEFRKPLLTSLELQKLIVEYRKFVNYVDQDVILHDNMQKSLSFILDN